MPLTMTKDKVPGAKKGAKRKTEDPVKATEAAVEAEMQREAAEAAQASANYFDENSVEVMTIKTKVVGLRFYDGVVYPGEMVVLRREPTNPYDANAIRVDNLAGIKVGHISSKNGDAGIISPVMASGKIVIDAYAPERKGHFDMPAHLKVWALPEDVESVSSRLYKWRNGGSSSSSSCSALRIKAETSAEKRAKSRDEMEKLYGDIKKKLAALTPIQPPDALMTELLDHQKKGVAWMVAQESTPTDSLPPLWSEKSEGRDTVFYNEVSNSSTRQKPHPVQGGILADDMGLGKTIQTLALALCRPAPHKVAYKAPPKWVQCDECEKWRKIPGDVNVDALPEQWSCSLNEWDKKHSNCDATEEVEVPLLAGPESLNPEELAKLGSTLIVCPASVLSNWQEQILSHIVPDTVTVGMYHGNERTYEALDCDFVITSYGVLTSEYREHERHKNKKRKIVKFFDKEWHRVVMDEAHNLRNPKTQQFKAAMGLAATHRWCLTGTPVQNRTEDCFALFKFLQLAPFNNEAIFKQSVARPVKNGEMIGLTRLKAALGSTLIRRVKNEMAAELNLPDKSVNIVKVDMGKEAREIYTTLHSAAKAVFNVLRAHDAVLSNYSAVLEVMLRLRQVCLSSELLPPGRLEAAKAVLERLEGMGDIGAGGADAPTKLSKDEAEALLNQLRKSIVGEPAVGGNEAGADGDAVNDTVECSICLGDTTVDDARIIRNCSHSFCYTCLDAWRKAKSEGYDSTTTCPLCRAKYTPKDLVDYSTLQAAVYMPIEEDRGVPPCGADSQTSGSSSSSSAEGMSIKLDYLVQQLKGAPSDEKTVVFSSFTSFLDLAGRRLTESAIKFVRIDGSMTVKNRVKGMHAFNKGEGEDAPTVCLISLKAGGTGLNLTRANNVVLLDLWWNVQVDEQAIDRCHRIGQTREVKVSKIVVKNSIEERILDLQKHKENLAAGALGSKDIASDRLDQLSSLLD